MNSDLTNLVRLQEIDIRIQQLESSKEEFPRAVEDLEGAIAQAENDVAQIEQKLRDARKAKGDAEDEIQTARNSLENTQERLSKITTNREYDAVHAEIESHKHVLANSETRLKSHSDEIASLQSALEEAKKELEEIRSANEPKAKELKGRIATIDSEIAKVQEERDAVAQEVSKPSLRPYERIRNRRKAGHAIGLITEGDRACPVCFKVLEVQLLNQIRRGNVLCTCQSCGSLLIWHEAKPEEPAAEEEPLQTASVADSDDPGEETVAEAEEQTEEPEQASSVEPEAAQAESESDKGTSAE